MKCRQEENFKGVFLHMSGVKSSGTVKLPQLQIRLINLLIKHKDDKINIRLNTLYKISNVTVTLWWLTFYKTALIHNKSKSRENNTDLKKTVLKS